jgi:hypothetical protein
MKEQWAPDRLLNQLLAFFTIAVTILAAVGIFGLITYVTAQRAREIGVRLSLGARPSQMLKSKDLRQSRRLDVMNRSKRSSFGATQSGYWLNIVC